MATYYWVGGGTTTDWDMNSGTSNWASSSGGSPLAAPIVTTSSDDCFFDANSGVTTGTIGTFGTSFCRNLTIVSASTGASSGTLDISGNYSSDGSVAISPSTVIFTATSTKTITDLTGATNVEFNGIGGEWQLQATYYSSQPILFTNGTLNTNGYTFTFGSAIDFAFGAGTTGLKFGSSNVFFTNSQTFYDGLTITAGTSDVFFYGTASFNHTGTLTFNKITVEEGRSITIDNSSTGTLNIGTLVIQPPSSIYSTGSTLTIQNYSVTNVNAWSVDGNSFSRNTIYGVSGGTGLTSTDTTVNVAYLNLTDLIVDDTSTTWTADSTCVNNGGNTGWIFSTPANANKVLSIIAS